MPSASPSADQQSTLPTASPSHRARRASLKVLSRNINRVVLGNLLFQTWYYSPYPDSIILGEDHISSQSHHGSIQARVNGAMEGASEQAASAMTPSSFLKMPTTLCDRLHVCPYCFRYTPRADSYIQHLQRHTVTYSPNSRSSSTSEDKSSDNDEVVSEISSDEETSTWPVPSTAVKVYEYAGYTVWDIDGEREKLYCQNLSLFGKLFLEQKSVFFDTGGFHYFVLTYTPPLQETSPTTVAASPKRSTIAGPSRAVGRRRTLSAAASGGPTVAEVRPQSTLKTILKSPISVNPPLRTHVLGFFSKETLSWDANNLACILVFPPYQHRNLGQLLMAISYKLSGWEWENSIIGGPEKPLSAMGRRSYLRFWSERVVRFMMGQTADADGHRLFENGNSSNDDNKRRRKKVGFSREEMTVKQIGDCTGMLAEDVIAALNEMGVLEMVPPPPTSRQKKKSGDGDGNNGIENEDELHTIKSSSMIVHRSKVLDWARRTGVDLVSPVREEGFLGEWALSEVEDEDENEDDAEQDEGEGEGEVSDEVDESE